MRKPFINSALIHGDPEWLFGNDHIPAAIITTRYKRQDDI